MSSRSVHLFALKIAILNSLLFLFIALGDTIVDPLTKSRIGFGARTYPWSYWVVLVSIPIFLSSYYLTIQPRSYWLKSILPFIVSFVISSIVSTLNFGSPYPPLGQMIAFIQFGWGILAAMIYFSDSGHLVIQDTNITTEAKYEWVKAKIEFWRTLTLTATIGFFTIIYVVFDQVRVGAAKLATDPIDIDLLQNYHWLQNHFFGAYIILGVLYESFSKSKEFGDHLISIGKQTHVKKEEVAQKV